MPATLRYPGVYIEEVPSGVRTIVGVATSITAFVGRAARGPVDEPVRVQSFGEYERGFGGLVRGRAAVVPTLQQSRVEGRRVHGDQGVEDDSASEKQ